MFEKLFEPIKLGPIEVKNRIAAAPMGVGWLKPDGLVTQEFLAHYAAKAIGGVGLIIKGNVWVNEWAMGDATTHLRLYDPIKHLPGISDFAEVIHACGAKLILQLSTGWGCQAHGAQDPNTPLPATPSGITLEPIKLENVPKGFKLLTLMHPPTVRVITVEEIKQQVAAVGKSAFMAFLAGVDGVEIHGCHGYLVHQFLSQRFNKRTDEYGGSLENRMKFLVEQVQSIKASVGNNIAVGVRISGDEHMPGGLEHREVKMVCKRIEELGVDYIHLSDGCYEAMKYFEPGDDDTAEHVASHAASLKKVLKIPVITPAIHDPYQAERVVGEGKADMISMARQLIVDPEWANKVNKGNFKAIKRCTRCNVCFQRRVLNLTIRCPLNPNAGREIYIKKYRDLPLLKKAYVPNLKKILKLTAGIENWDE